MFRTAIFICCCAVAVQVETAFAAPIPETAAGSGVTIGSGMPKSVELVKNGKPLAIIVSTSGEMDAKSPGAKSKIDGTPKSAGDAQAATLLVDWIKKMTGAELQIVSRPVEGVSALFVGRAALDAGLNLDGIASPSGEGNRIICDGSRILLAGRSDIATLKAACRFLEELGCRYFMDGPLGEVYPRTNRLVVGAFEITEKPGLLMRNAKGPSWRADLWKVWNGGEGDRFNHAHSWGSYIEPGLFEEHPEYFAMTASGERRRGDWLCTSSPELREYFAARVISRIQAGTKHPSISPPDGRGYCQCSACRAQDHPDSVEPSSGAVSVSARYADFFDFVGRRVAEKCPDSILSFYCYADYTQPANLGRRLSPNLCAVIAPIRYCRLHPIGDPGCPGRRQQADMIEGWGREVPRLGYYNYMYNLADATYPFFKFTACKREFPYLAARGLQVMTLEVISNWHIYGPQIYLGLRLAYDPQADPEAIMEDYWQRFYGSDAAPFMKEYWMSIDSAVVELKTHAGGFHGIRQAYTPKLLRQCGHLLSQAARAAEGDPVFSQRVALHSEGWRSAVEMRQLEDAAEAGDFVRVRVIYGGMIERLRSLAARGWANKEYATAYLERFLGRNIDAVAEASQSPNKVLSVLPDAWAVCDDPGDAGRKHGWQTERFDHSSWPIVTAYSNTLDSHGRNSATVVWYRNTFKVPKEHQRLILFFMEVDGIAEVFVNGKSQTPESDLSSQGGRRPRQSFFGVDVTGSVKPGQNALAVRVDNRSITELFRGGILRPVVLIERP